MTDSEDEGVIARLRARPMSRADQPQPPFAVLVIDDTPEDRMAVRLALEAGGFALQEATDAERGLALARSAHFDCILLDYGLPDQEGLEVLAALHGPDGRLPCAVVMLTGSGRADVATAALKAGAHDYIVKHQLDDEGSLRRAIHNAVRDFRLGEEHRSAERRNAELAAIVAASGDAIISLDADLTVQTWNRGAELLFGYGAGEARGRRIADLIVPPSHAGEPAELGAAVLKRKETVRRETIRRCKDGRLVPVDMTSAPILDASGRPVAIATIVRDISATRAVEARLTDSRERLRSALDAADVGTWRIDFKARRNTRDASLSRLLGLAPAETTTPLEERANFIHPEDAAACQAAWEEACADDGRYDVVHRIVRADGAARWVRDRGRITFDAGGAPRSAVGALVDITDRRLAEEAVRASEARFRRAADAARALVYEVDVAAEGARIADAYGVEHIIGERGEGPLTSDWWHARIHPADAARHVDHLAATIRDPARQVYQASYRVRHADGSWRDVEDTARIVRDAGGRPTRLVGTILDVSERKASEDRLRASEERLSLALEAARMGTWSWDVATGRGTVSTHNKRLFGLPDESTDAMSEDFAVLVHPDDIERVRRSFLRAAEARAPYDAEFRIRRPDGQERWLHSLGRVFLDTQGGARLIGITHDVTETKAAEAALRESEARFRSMANTTPAIVWAASPDGTITFHNQRWLDYTGIAQTDNVADWPRRVLHPDDYERCTAAWRHALATGSEYEIEVRNRHHSGAYRWFLTRATPIRGGDGRILAWYGSTTDIHDRKVAEERLRDSEERFRTIFATAQEGIWAFDAEGRTMFANPRIAELLGTAPAEMDGRPMVDFCFREDIEDGRERLATNLAGETEEFEFRFRRADGTPLHVLAATAPLKGRDGAIIGALGGYLDLTERKKAEERQRVLMREVTHRGKNLLAVVQSIASRTLATGRTIEDARQAFLGRLQALGRTYSSLTDEQFEGALLDEIVAAELRPFGARAEISGPRIMLAARVAQTFGLVVHELATNAVKYGALSVPKGRIAVAWRVDGTGAGARFRFEWTERNGPPASEPVRKGFGSTLISVVASAEFKCAPMISFGADGFRYRLDAVLADVGSVIDESPVRGKLQSETLRDFYDAWANLAVGGRLPTLKRFPRARFSATGGLTVVEIDSSLGVRQLESGRALTEKVGRLVPDGALAGDDPDSMMEAYRRCARSRMPCYEHLRFDFGDGHVVTFERLLVPFSRGGRRVTHLAGLVVYTGRTTPGRARPRSDASGSRD